MKHTWNDEKAAKVKAEHKVEFEKLADVFDDVFSVDFLLMTNIRPKMKFVMR